MSTINRSVFKYAFFIIFYSLGQLTCHSVDEIQKKYANFLQKFNVVLQQKNSTEYPILVDLFENFQKPSGLLLKQVRQDIQKIKKTLKKEKSSKLVNLSHDLARFMSFLKKHKVIYDALLVHRNIKHLYQKLFDLLDKNQDIISYIMQHKNQFDLQQNDQYCLHTFVENIKKHRHKISQIEDYVHSDYIDLKLQNYVYKIELVKLRNAIIFDQRYRIQKKK